MVRRGLDPDKVTLAAAEVADDVGLEAVTVARVARVLDVRPPSLYSHVGGTDDLRTRLSLLALEEIAEATTAAAAGRSGRDALAAVADALRDYARRHPGRYEAARRRLDPATAAASAGGRSRDALAAVLRGYAVPAAEQAHAVRVLSATVHGFISLESAGGFAHSEPSSTHSWNRMVDAVDRVLTTWPDDS